LVSNKRDTDSQAYDVDEQHRRLKRAFVHGWVSPARDPVTFNEEQLARIEHVRDHGGWLNRQEAEYLQRLRDGARRGDPLPAAPPTREPYIDGCSEDFDVRIVGADDDARGHSVLPRALAGAPFRSPFPAPNEADGYESVWLKEEVETGALARQMLEHPGPDGDGIIWTNWDGHRLGRRTHCGTPASEATHNSWPAVRFLRLARIRRRYRNAVSLRISFPAGSSNTAVAGSCTEAWLMNGATSASASSLNVTLLAKRGSTCAMSAPAL
jgi:hypothetical protein